MVSVLCYISPFILKACSLCVPVQYVSLGFPTLLITCPALILFTCVSFLFVYLLSPVIPFVDSLCSHHAMPKSVLITPGTALSLPMFWFVLFFFLISIVIVFFLLFMPCYIVRLLCHSVSCLRIMPCFL